MVCFADFEVLIMKSRVVRKSKRLALPRADLEIPGSNPTGRGMQFMFVRRFIAFHFHISVVSI